MVYPILFHNKVKREQSNGRVKFFISHSAIQFKNIYVFHPKLALINVKMKDSLYNITLALSTAAAQVGACSRACSGANELVPIGYAVCVG